MSGIDKCWEDGALASCSLPGQCRAQGGLVFSMLSQQEPNSSTEGMVLTNESTRSPRRGRWEHCHLLHYKYPCYRIHSALTPGTRLSLQITSFISSQVKWKNPASEEQRTNPYCRHNGEAGTVSHESVSQINRKEHNPGKSHGRSLFLASVGTFFCQSGTNQARPCSSV